MELKFVKYKDSYRKDAAEMMSKTWFYDKSFEGLDDRILFYSIIFDMSYFSSTYCDLVIDENDKLVGILTASPTKQKFSFKKFKFELNAISMFLSGKFGKRLPILKTIPRMFKDMSTLMADLPNHDNEISLFFVDESTRGQGLGNKLMDRYIEYCRENDINSVILLTDAGCNYGFYDHYGFNQINKIHSDFFAKPEVDFNGFAYSIKVK